MDALIAKLEAAVGPSRELDTDIAFVVLAKDNPRLSADGYITIDHPVGPYCDGYLVTKAPEYTFSIDAALTLVPEGWRWWHTSDDKRSPNYQAAHRIELYGPAAYTTPICGPEYMKNWARSSHNNCAIALVIAALRARATPAASGGA